MASLLESSLTTNSIHRLQTRHSYLSKASHQRPKSKRELLHGAALRLCPVIWLAPAILRAHDKHEYEKDRRYVHEVYVEYQEHGRSRKDSLVVVGGGGGGAGGTVRGSIVDLRIHPAPVEWTPGDGARRDWWRGEKLVAEDDPWRLPPMNEII